MSQNEVARGGNLTSLTDLEVICDADAHITESWDEVLSYLNGSNQGIKRVLQKAKYPLHDVFTKSHATPAHPYRDADMYNYIIDNPIAKLDEMDEHGIDCGVLTPSLFAGLSTINNSNYAVALATAYNNWLADTFHTQSSDRYRTGICIPTQEPSKAAEEIDRMASDGEVVGVQFSSTGPLPPAGDRQYDPIYQAAVDNDLTIFMHGSVVNGLFCFPTQERWSETEAETHAWSHPFGHMWNLTTMLFRGVPERFPDLDFVLQESGVAWVPYWKWRLDDHYLERSYDIPGLEKLPSEYIDDQFYFTTQPLGLTADRPEYLAWAIEMAGPENILWASDLPHPDFDTPEELFDRVKGYFEPEVVRGMMGETAADLFDISG